MKGAFLWAVPLITPPMRSSNISVSPQHIWQPHSPSFPHAPPCFLNESSKVWPDISYYLTVNISKVITNIIAVKSHKQENQHLGRDFQEAAQKVSKWPFKDTMRGFPSGSVLKNLPVSAGYMGSIPGLGRWDPTCLEAAGPVHHNYWACALKVQEPQTTEAWAP